MKKICKYCEKDYNSNYLRSKFCSKQCRIKQMKIDYFKNGKKKFMRECYLGKRFKIIKRDEFKCQYCGSKVKDGVLLEIDHIIPSSLGGSNAESNLITSCNLCNGGKGDILLNLREISLVRGLK